MARRSNINFEYEWVAKILIIKISDKFFLKNRMSNSKEEYVVNFKKKKFRGNFESRYIPARIWKEVHLRYQIFEKVHESYGNISDVVFSMTPTPLILSNIVIWQPPPPLKRSDVFYGRPPMRIEASNSPINFRTSWQ